MISLNITDHLLVIDINDFFILFSILILIYILYKIYKLFTFDDIVVDLSHTKWDNKHFDLKRLYKLEDLNPFYPNGWIPILEARDLKPNQIKPVFAFGYDLVVYRTIDGKVNALDAYCPHLGANIGVGGRVVGNSIRCPFHGWEFNANGVCTRVPGIECQNTPKVKIKVWDCIEINGFIFVWHHSDGQSANWFPIEINEIVKSKVVYRGRTEHTVNCHLQEIPENGADVMHLNELHSAPEFLGTVINKSRFYDIVLKFMHYKWTANWYPCPAPNHHIAHLDLRTNYSLFGNSFLLVNLTVQQIGPANVHLKLTFNLPLIGEINGYIIQTITPLGTMRHKIVHHFYTEPTLKGRIISIFMINGEARMIERDIIIWNNKKFLKTPYFAKTETTLVLFRRWFNQFYSDKCPVHW